MSSSTSTRGTVGRNARLLLLGLALACIGMLGFAGSQAKAVPFTMPFSNGQVNLGFAFQGKEILPAPGTIGTTPLPDLWDARATLSGPTGTGTPPNNPASFKPVGCLSQVTFGLYGDPPQAAPNDGQSGRALTPNPDYPCDPNPANGKAIGELDPATGAITIPSTGFQFPIMVVPNPLDQSPVPITIASTGDVTGTVDLSGNVSLSGPIEVRVLTGLASNPLGTYCALPLPARDGGGPFQLTTGKSFPDTAGFIGTPYSAITGPGALTGTWNVTADSVSVGGADCATVNSVSKGLGGLWLGTDIAEPTPWTCADLVPPEVGTYPDCEEAVASVGRVTVTGPGKTKKGKVAMWKVKITNTGNSPLTGVRTAVSGRGVKFNSPVATIAPGATRTETVRAKLTRVGKFTATVRVTSANGGSKTVKKAVNVVK